MCGITGYIGNRDAAVVLLDGLSKLEYRGYVFYSQTDTEVARAGRRLGRTQQNKRDDRLVISFILERKTRLEPETSSGKPRLLT